MRNLKKFLALVLAMVMAFSLMLSASAANTAKDFDDAASITPEFVEATDVLTGMKVFQGDEGGFRPGDTIIRAEVAALIYRLATGDVDDVRSGAYANFGNFTDVNESDWFAGYVGYCANAGYIKGTSETTFDPYAPVTGYETLAMILRAIGYDKNNEFTGATWETNVSALATQLGILTNIKTTHYGNTLYLASRRDVVAELLFQADAFVPMVVYTPAFGYQPYGVTGGVVGSVMNPTLGKHIFGLAMNDNGILLGNQQTGETGSVMGYAGSKQYLVSAAAAGNAAVYDYVDYSAYTWQGAEVTPANSSNGDAVAIGDNVKYELETGIDLVGHRLKLWYDDGTGVVSNNNKHVFAYFDKADTAVIKAANTDLTGDDTDSVNDLGEAIVAEGYKLNKNSDGEEIAVFNNSFGKFGSGDDFASAANVGNGEDDNNPAPIASPVKLYKIIDNDGDKKIDAIISLNIESSQITESNNVNRVPTIGMPVTDLGDVPTGATPAQQLETMFITTGTGGAPGTLAAGKNVKQVPATNGVFTGVIAQAALVGNSTKTLGDYEMGIHITGTTPRTVSSAETTAISGTGEETAYFLLSKVTAPVEGTVVAYNVDAGTVTLDNGIVLERSMFYDTVVVTNPKGSGITAPNAAVTDSQAPVSAIPQAWLHNSANTDLDVIGKWREGYANVTYKFYLDYEGKYLGAERTFGSSFLYGTYQDYSQATSTSTFNYYLTGVTLDGEIKTVQLKKYWSNTTTCVNITGTDNLGVPYRDTISTGGGTMNGIGENPYVGFAILGETADGNTTDANDDRNEYLNNMARLGVKYADGNAAFTGTIDIDDEAVALGAKETVNGQGKYFTEATKFILVSGFGTDSVKAEVYNGITELKKGSSHVFLNMDTSQISLQTGWTASGQADPNTMTYFTESPYTYAQTGDTNMKIDTIILPKKAVSWTGGSGLYYVGNPTAKLVNSWGEDAWKYDLYLDGELQEVWLTNDPSDDTNTGTKTYQLTKDTFYNLKDTGNTANDGKPIYTAGNYNGATWTPGTGINNSDPTRATVGTAANQYTMTGVRYSAVTRDAQTATFTTYDGSDDSNNTLYRVAEAKVVNTNTGAKATAGAFGDTQKSQSGEIWPGITNLTTLNEAGSINPVTGRALRVSAVVDSSNDLVVTTIYVCYEQDWS